MEMELTILMPCLNEAKTIATCINRAKKLLEENRIHGEILVSDNGSTDNSQEIAAGLGARVINCPVKGYGAALQFGIEKARGRYILMADSDDSYHFDEAIPMIENLRRGYEVCMGTRLKGRIMPDAMPWLNRYIGNPVLTTVGRIFFDIPLTDFQCGMRAFRKDSILGLNLITTGMEWATEMIVKAKLGGLKITEVPITLYKDGRDRKPHLRPWRDGWRHLRFMLLHTPRWLFFIPGSLMMVTGFAGKIILLPGMFRIGKVNFDVHSMLVMTFLLILGVQVTFTGIFATLYGHITGILPYNERFNKTLRKLTLEKLLIACLLLGIAGSGGFLYTFWDWYRVGFSELNYQVTLRKLIPSLTLITVSVQGMFNGFMLSLLFMKIKDHGRLYQTE
jgi:glycosyltransferase involved in cell wall biosynthesis